MTRLVAVLLGASLIGCGRSGLPGLAPDAEPVRGGSRPLAVHSDGRFEGAAIGWTLGGEVHLFVADTAFTRLVYELVVRPNQGGDPPPSFDSAFNAPPRRVLSLAAERIPGRPKDPGYFDATILHAAGAIPAALTLIRLHRPGDCSAAVPGAVTELVYSFPQAALPVVPPSHTTVAGVFRSPPYLRSDTATPPGLDREAARRLVARVARAAERRTAPQPPREGAGDTAAAVVRRLVLDADQATDAGEALPLSGRDVGRFAVAARVRYRQPAGDTVFVSAVAITDTGLVHMHWVMRPVRARFAGNLLAEGVRYALRGVVVYPPTERELLLVDRIADVEAGAARRLAVDPWQRRVVAAQPLALRCR